MSDRAAKLNVAARHVALSQAIRARDPLAAARAASRLRIPGASLSARELETARRARAAVGRALVRARLTDPAERRRAAAAYVARAQVIPRLLRRRAFPVWRALGAATIIAVLVVLFRPGGGYFGGGSTEEHKPAGVNVPANATLRGRSVGQATAVVVASPRPTTTPPVVVPGTTGSPAPIGGAGGGAPVPGGGGGFGSPAPAGTPPLPGLDYGRITVIVVDSQTQQPVSGVCVIMGSDRCNGTTDAQGRWSGDIKLPAPRVPFDLHYSRSGYITASKQTELIQGREVIERISLVRG